jgi:hypothetical protein
VFEENEMMDGFEQYTHSVVPLKSYTSLPEDWLWLETRTETSFFLSWSWIGTWLKSYFPNIDDASVDVLCVHYNGELVALSLLYKSVFSQWKRFSSKRLHINQTGNPVLDQIWTEYNGLLCLSEHEAAVYSSAIVYLIKHYDGWDELQVGAITKKLADNLHETSGLSRLDLWDSPSYGVDLVDLKEKKIDFLDSLSRNTRYQIRRSLKLYADQGGIKLQFATNEFEALQYFQEISPLHMEKWGKKPGESGFSNPEFMKFHKNLISVAFQLKQVDLIKIYCGERVLGYLYNFLYKGKIYFYLSGLVSEQDSKLKPGLCAHALVIQHYMDKGYVFYDFMGGKDRYKSSLGSEHEKLYHISLQKDRLKFKVESFLRHVKQHFAS